MDIHLSPHILVRLLKGAPISCLAALALTGKPAQARELRQITGYAAHTVSEALELLGLLGMASYDSHRSTWQATAEAAETLHGWMEAAAEAEEPAAQQEIPANEGAEGKNTPDRPDPPTAKEAPHPNRRGRPAPRAAKNAAFRTANGDTVDAQESETGGELTTVVVNLNKAIIKLTTTTAQGEACAQGIPVRQVLMATEGLFGEAVMGPAERYGDGRELLASIAQAYVERDQLRKPARVVYTNLKREVPPPRRYLEDPLAYLPASFLEEAGLGPQPSTAGTCPQPSTAGTSLPITAGTSPLPSSAGTMHQPNTAGTSLPSTAGTRPLPITAGTMPQPITAGTRPPERQTGEGAEERLAEDEEEDKVEADPSVQKRVDPDGQQSAEQAWECGVKRVLEQVEASRTRERILEARLVRYEEPGVFVARAASESDCEWLNERLARRLGRELVGVCARAVEARYEYP